MSEGAAEVPIIQEGEHHTEQDLEQQTLDGSTAAAAGETLRPGLTLTLPPSGGATDPTGRRWSLDAASVHSESWELLSHRDGAHSHCGSSPRSLSPSDTYDSEGEGEAARRRATAAALLAALPVPGGAAAAPASDDLVPFGSLVLDGREPSPLAAAVAAADSAPTSPTAAPLARAGSGSGSLVSSQPGSPMLGPGSVPPSVVSSPRSSYERPSSHASRHDLYSLSQDDHLSDHDSYIDDMMLRGEPELSGEMGEGSEPAGPDEVAKPPALTRTQLALAPAAAVATAARGALAATSTQLCALAASVSAYLARIVPAGAGMVQRAVLGLAEVVGTLRERFAPLGIAPLVRNVVAVHEHVKVAVQRARKQMAHKPVNWKGVALLLGGACGITALLLQRSWAEQARLAALLSKRETDLARLLSRVMELQSRITTAHRGGPLVRHVSMPLANASYHSTPHWPAVIVV